MADDESGAIATPPSPIHEDQPRRLDPGLPPEMTSPLAPFHGAVVPGPAWFDEALARAPERTRVPVLGADIELLTWGERGKPGLILVHGNSAHADWWSFIAPFLAGDFRVAALSLSGMGGSGWRERYSRQTFATEIFACAAAAGLYYAPVKPVYVGHSFGGVQVFHSAVHHPERMRACVLVDTGFGGPPTEEELVRWEREELAAGRTPEKRLFGAPRGGAHRVYPTLEAALTRFRFMPPQIPGNLYITDFIARGSLKRAPFPEGGGEGWTWKFDPDTWTKMDHRNVPPEPESLAVPMVHIYGDRSAIIFGPRAGRDDRGPVPASVPRIVIPDSEHHIMVDQPLALVAALRTLLAVWPGSAA
jgi:pimeloyl-ACP methyl ester carboxylesterase